jgi:hypothetical protein
MTKTQAFGELPMGILSQDNPSHDTQHTMYMSPLQDTWIKSIKNGHFATWPSLMVDNVRKYLPKYDAMLKGHMNQIRQCIRSTQNAVTEPTPEPETVQEGKCSYIYSSWRKVKSLQT